MVQFEAIFAGIAVSSENRSVVAGEISLFNTKEAVFKTNEGDILSLNVDQWRFEDNLTLTPGNNYLIDVVFEISSSRFMGVCTMAQRATAVNIFPQN